MKKTAWVVRYIAITVLAVFVYVGTSEALPRYSELYPFLVDLKGWKAGAPTGMNMAGPTGEMVTAERRYERAGASLTASIVSGVGAYSAWTPFSMGITLDSPDTFMKTLSLKGYPAGVNHNKKDSSGVVVVLIKSAETNSVALVLDYQGIGPEEAISLAKRFPFKKIEGAFK